MVLSSPDSQLLNAPKVLVSEPGFVTLPNSQAWWLVQGSGRASLRPSQSPLTEQRPRPQPSAVPPPHSYWSRGRCPQAQPGTLALGQLFLPVLRLSCGLDLPCPQSSPISSAFMPAAGPNFSPFVASHLTGQL